MCRDVGQMKQIDILPDDVLLEIFDFYVITDSLHELEDIPPGEIQRAIEAWQLLVHVCRRWRRLVLGSPRRLNLRLFCTSKTPIRDTLDVWPALPLVVDSGGFMGFSSDTDNIIAALGHNNRICQVDLYFWDLEEVLAAMQVPFPELTDLQITCTSVGAEPVIPDSFLDGSAPRLQFLELRGIPFPGLPKLLSTTTNLVEIELTDIPHSWYISRWSLSFPLYPSLEYFPLNSNPVNPALPVAGAGKAEVCLYQNNLSSPLSGELISEASSNI